MGAAKLLTAAGGGVTLDAASTATDKTITIPAANGTMALTSQLNGFRNRIINGAMMIDQRNAGASVSTSSGSSAYITDRWFVAYTQTSKMTAQQNAGSVTPPVGFTNYLGITSSSAYSVVTGDTLGLFHRIEGLNLPDIAWGTANAAVVTLSFWVRSSLTGTFGGAFQNSAADRSYPFSYTISAANTWEQKTITVAGDTSGTWLTTNGIGIQLVIGLGSGATYSGTANTWAAGNLRTVTGATSVVGTNGATFYITGVQLEKGTVATSFDWRPYTTELQLCQRYLPCFNANISFGGVAPISSVFASAANSALATIPFMVQPRVPPTGVTVSNSSDFTVNLAGVGVTGTIAFAYGSLVAGSVSITQSGRTAGQAGYFYATASTAQIQFTGCEL
jgi:hypothetical protein